MVRYESTYVIELSGAGVSPWVYLDHLFWSLRLESRWIPSPPLIATMLIAPKGVDPSGSGCT